MRVSFRWMILPLASAALMAQSAIRVPAGAGSAVTADDIKQLREALAMQQQQIQELREQLAQRDQQMHQQAEAIRQLQAGANDAVKGSVLHSSNQAGEIVPLQNDLKDGKRSPGDSAIAGQEEQQHAGLHP